MSLYFIIVGTFALGVWLFVLALAISRIISNRVTKELGKQKS